MAVTSGGKLGGPAEADRPPVPQSKHVNFWLAHPLSMDREQSDLIYDRPTDTMLVLPHGRDRASFAVNIVDSYFVLVDAKTEELIGIQIEDYLYRAVREDPFLVELLDYADLLGMTVEDVRHERHRVLGYRGRFKLWLERIGQGIARRNESRQQYLVDTLQNRGRLGSTIRNALGSA
jgi:hypothetical protein